MHSKQSISPQYHTIKLKLFLLPQGAHFFCSLIVREALHQPVWQSISTRKRDMWKSYFSLGKQGRKLYIEEAITSWSDTVTHFSQLNSRRSLQAWSYRLLTRLAMLLTQASSAMPNRSRRFSMAHSETPGGIWYSSIGSSVLWYQQEWRLWSELTGYSKPMGPARCMWFMSQWEG